MKLLKNKLWVFESFEISIDWRQWVIGFNNHSYSNFTVNVFMGPIRIGGRNMVSNQRTQSPEIDIESDTWKAVEGKITKNRQELMEDNNSVRLTPEKTAFIRGRIRQCEEHLEMPQKKTSI